VKTYLRATEPAEVAALERSGYEGLALGAEFCPQRLPGHTDAVRAGARCRDRGLGFCLVTPVVREAAFDAVSRWLAALSRELPGTECTMNDWGLLHWVRQEGLPLALAAGRLLGRQRRDPRVVSMARTSPPEEASALRGGLWDDPVSVSLLHQLGVRRVELDLLLQGTRRPSLPQGVALSLCGPWIPVTFSPSCSWSADPLLCSRPCCDAEAVILRNEEDPYPLWSRGNALFARVEAGQAGAAANALGADRVVWSEAVPG
jgi:hypothetical protein